MVWTSSRHGSIPQSSLMYWKTTTTTCWSVAFSSPFSLPPWSANGWQKSNCSTELGGNVTDEQTPISVSPHEAARRTSQPDERQLRNIPVGEHRSRFSKAHMELQGWGNKGWGWRLEGLELVLCFCFLTYFASPVNYFIPAPFFFCLCHLTNRVIKLWILLSQVRRN